MKWVLSWNYYWDWIRFAEVEKKRELATAFSWKHIKIGTYRYSLWKVFSLGNSDLEKVHNLFFFPCNPTLWCITHCWNNDQTRSTNICGFTWHNFIYGHNFLMNKCLRSQYLLILLHCLFFFSFHLIREKKKRRVRSHLFAP